MQQDLRDEAEGAQQRDGDEADDKPRDELV